MKNLFDVAVANQVKQRIDRLQIDSKRQWGKMTVAQAAAHCASGLQMALGEIKPRRVFMGRLLSPIIKPKVFGNDEPFRRNSPTAAELVVSDDRDLDDERARLHSLIDRFVSGGASACTTHPHPLFGPLSPAEWAILMYKHLDHHLRQFHA